MICSLRIPNHPWNPRASVPGIKSIILRVTQRFPISELRLFSHRYMQSRVESEKKLTEYRNYRNCRLISLLYCKCEAINCMVKVWPSLGGLLFPQWPRKAVCRFFINWKIVMTSYPESFHPWWHPLYRYFENKFKYFLDSLTQCLFLGGLSNFCCLPVQYFPDIWNS